MNDLKLICNEFISYLNFYLNQLIISNSISVHSLFLIEFQWIISHLIAMIKNSIWSNKLLEIQF